MAKQRPDTALPSPARLRELLSYDEATGLLAWRVRRGPVGPGSIVKTMATNGYIQLAVDYCGLRAHRVIWAIMTGEWPAGEVDHINRNRADNRWCNLRAATSSNNQHNRIASKNNTSGVKGVSFYRSRNQWMTHITVKGRRIDMRFDTMAEAVAARRMAAFILHGDFVNHG